MQPSRNQVEIVRFGPFEVDSHERVLRKHGVRVRLQSQPFQVLSALLENAGTLVTREELRRRIWQENTFVDFEHGLNAAVTRLRQALGDSAARPRYIETAPKSGYRFIAEIQRSATVLTSESPCSPEPAGGGARALGRQLIVGILSVAAALIVTLAGLVPPRRSEAGSAAFRALPLTSFRGQECSPALSPDGKSVAFAWDRERDNFDIYVMRLGSPAPTRLTTSPQPDLTPAWSPDGRTIAFLRRVGTDKADLVLMPATGGAERVLTSIQNFDLRPFPSGMRVSSLSWSPDGRWIAASHRAPGAITEAIHLFSMTGAQRQLTFPSLHSHGDHSPAFSPDGRTLAFCRLQAFNTSEMFALRLDGDLNPRGHPQPLTNHLRWSVSPVWTPDGSAILYVFGEVTNARSPRQVRVIDMLDSRYAERTIPFDPNVDKLSLGTHLVYSQVRIDTDIWRARISKPGEPASIPERFLDSTRSDYGARYSPDGRRVAFVSMRSGSPDLWVAEADASNPVRITSLRQVSALNPPSWSPDGQWLLFSGRNGAFLNLFAIPSRGGTPLPVTNSAFDENMAVYSRDGSWIYFNSMRSGRRQVWRMPVSGGDAVQITTGGGLRPVESLDGKSVFYVAESGGAIWQVPVGGGKETEVVSCVHPTAYGFALTAEGIYFRDCSESGKQYIRLYSLTTGQSRPVAEANEAPFGASLSVSPDGNYLLFDQAAKMDVDLSLLENFRVR